MSRGVRGWARVTGLALALVACAGGTGPLGMAGTAHAQWRTDDGGLWGARRCQSRNLISAGFLLGSLGAPLLAHEEHVEVGVGFMLGGAAVALTGVGLRVRLRGDPGRDGPHDVWPEDRCQARSLSLRGGVYLVTAIIGVVRLLRLPDNAGTPTSRAIVALMAVVPQGLIGLVFSVVGLRRLRRLGPRPDASVSGMLAAQGAEQGLLLAYPFEF